MLTIKDRDTLKVTFRDTGQTKIVTVDSLEKDCRHPFVKYSEVGTGWSQCFSQRSLFKNLDVQLINRSAENAEGITFLEDSDLLPLCIWLENAKTYKQETAINHMLCDKSLKQIVFFDPENMSYKARLVVFDEPFRESGPGLETPYALAVFAKPHPNIYNETWYDKIATLLENIEEHSRLEKLIDQQKGEIFAEIGVVNPYQFTLKLYKDDTWEYHLRRIIDHIDDSCQISTSPYLKGKLSCPQLKIFSPSNRLKSALKALRK